MEKNEKEIVNKITESIPFSKLVRFKHRLQDHATVAELTFKGFLEELGIPFYFQRGVYVDENHEKFRIVDFYIARVKIIFEIDGEYHNNLLQHGKDVLREMQVKDQKRHRNSVFVRFTNQEVLSQPEDVKQKIREVYNGKLTEYYNKKRKFSERTKGKYRIV